MKDKRTYADRAEYLKKAVAKRRKKIRVMAVATKGGTCGVCGYNRCIGALEFHHPDSSKKEFSISSDGMTRLWKRVQSEIRKCILVCANCHREIHAGMLQLPTATSVEN